MPGVVFQSGERVTLRTIEKEDTEVLQRARNEPNFRRGLLFRYPANQTMVETFIEDVVENDDDSLQVLLCVDEKAVGFASLFNIRQAASATLSYWLLPESRGEGYATEGVALLIDHAFQTLGLHHLVAWTIDYNESSQALLDRLGFTHEGTYREHIFRQGEHNDTEHYGLLAPEWERQGTI